MTRLEAALAVAAGLLERGIGLVDASAGYDEDGPDRHVLAVC